MRSLVGGSATEFLLGDDELEDVNGEQRIDADLTLVSASRDAHAASPSQPQRRRRGHGCRTNVVPRLPAKHRPETTKPRNCGAFECAEEDSNLHPLSVDQALNLVTRVSDTSYASITSRSSGFLDGMDDMDDLDVATDVATRLVCLRTAARRMPLLGVTGSGAGRLAQAPRC